MNFKRFFASYSCLSLGFYQQLTNHVTIRGTFIPMSKWVSNGFISSSEFIHDHFPPRLVKKDLHGGLKFGPLPPLSCDGICIPSQVWSTEFLSEKHSEFHDNPNNSLRRRRFGPYHVIQTQVWSIRRESYFSETFFGKKVSGPNLRRNAYAVI